MIFLKCSGLEQLKKRYENLTMMTNLVSYENPVMFWKSIIRVSSVTVMNQHFAVMCIGQCKHIYVNESVAIIEHHRLFLKKSDILCFFCI